MKEENIYSGPIEAARGLVDFIVQTMEKDKTHDFNIALSGGESVAVLYEVWQNEFADKTDWNRVYFYWVDERCVLPFSENSNFKTAYEILLDKVPIKSNHYYRILGEAPPEETALMYSALVKSRIPVNTDGMIQFDFVLLGIGLDGHTSSIFPDYMDLLKVIQPYTVMHNPENEILRIGMTGYPMINASHTCFFVYGKAKHKIVKDIMMEENVDRYPASYVWNNAGNVTLFASFS